MDRGAVMIHGERVNDCDGSVVDRLMSRRGEYGSER